MASDISDFLVDNSLEAEGMAWDGLGCLPYSPNLYILWLSNYNLYFISVRFFPMGTEGIAMRSY